MTKAEIDDLMTSQGFTEYQAAFRLVRNFFCCFIIIILFDCATIFIFSVFNFSFITIFSQIVARRMLYDWRENNIDNNNNNEENKKNGNKDMLHTLLNALQKFNIPNVGDVFK